MIDGLIKRNFLYWPGVLGAPRSPFSFCKWSLPPLVIKPLVVVDLIYYSGRSREGPFLFLDQTEARRDEKALFGDLAPHLPPPLLKRSG